MTTNVFTGYTPIGSGIPAYHEDTVLNFGDGTYSIAGGYIGNNINSLLGDLANGPSILFNTFGPNVTIDQSSGANGFGNLVWQYYGAQATAQQITNAGAVPQNGNVQFPTIGGTNWGQSPDYQNLLHLPGDLLPYNPQNPQVNGDTPFISSSFVGDSAILQNLAAQANAIVAQYFTEQGSFNASNNGGNSIPYVVFGVNSLTANAFFQATLVSLVQQWNQNNPDQQFTVNAPCDPVDPTTGDIIFAPGDPNITDWNKPSYQSETPMQALADYCWQYTLDNYLHHLIDPDPNVNTVPRQSATLQDILDCGGTLSALVDQYNQLVQRVNSTLHNLGTIPEYTFIPTTWINTADDSPGSPPSLFGTPHAGSPNGHSTMDGSSGGQSISTFGGDNTLIAGPSDTLFGGSGANKFVFGSAAYSPNNSLGTVAEMLDYNQGSFPIYNPQQGDTIDVSQILIPSASSSLGSATTQSAASYLRAFVSPGLPFAILQVDVSGQGSNWVDLAIMHGVQLGDPLTFILNSAGTTGTITAGMDPSVGSSLPVVTAVTASTTGEAAIGSALTLTLSLSQPANISGGAPTLSLNDGGVATLDTTLSNPATGKLVFDYTVGTKDVPVGDLEVNSVNLNGASITGSGGTAFDLSAGIGAYTGLQVDPASVLSVAPTSLGYLVFEREMQTGDSITITVTMNNAVTVNLSQGSPILALNDGGSATYDTNASDPSHGLLVFDYTVGASDLTMALAIKDVSLNGSQIVDSSGVAADLSGASGLLSFDALGLGGQETESVNVSSVPFYGQIEDIYQSVLQRASTTGELTSQSAVASVSGIAAVVSALVDSSEAQFDVYPIVQIIKLATGNLPTAAQLAGWVPFIEQNGLLTGQAQTNPLLDQMAEAFVASDNFAKVYNPPFAGTDVNPNSPVTASEMQIIIKAATGIAATQTQVNAWVALGLTIDQVFVDFALGDQYTAFSQAGNQQYLATVADTAAGIQASASVVGSANASLVAHAA